MISAFLLGVYFLLDVQDFASQTGTGINAIGYFFTSVANSGWVSASQFPANLNQ